jgi:hypothetical protein
MPQIIVMADRSSDAHGQPVMFLERVSVSDFESRHFQTQLVERLGWAVGDADAVEQRTDDQTVDDAPAELADRVRSFSAAQPVS